MSRRGVAALDAALEGGAWTHLPESELAESGARVVEHDVLRAVDVGSAEASGFTAFLDGIQRSAVVGFRGPIPVVYAYAAAVVRVREDGELRTAVVAGEPLLREREALFFPFEHVDPVAFGGAAQANALVDTAPDGPVPVFPPLLYARATARINHWRESLERELADRWASAAPGDGFLLVDGSLTVSTALAGYRGAAGVVKSHRTRFFDGADARVVYGLEAGQRTSVFAPETRRFAPVRSWYLRLRDARGRDATWGLVRVELAADAADPERVDRVSRWLLAETRPPSVPDGRWDRLLYPILDCERFLRSRAPRV